MFISDIRYIDSISLFLGQSACACPIDHTVWGVSINLDSVDSYPYLSWIQDISGLVHISRIIGKFPPLQTEYTSSSAYQVFCQDAIFVWFHHPAVETCLFDSFSIL